MFKKILFSLAPRRESNNEIQTMIKSPQVDWIEFEAL